jgi:hypothetical protein
MLRSHSDDLYVFELEDDVFHVDGDDRRIEQ